MSSSTCLQFVKLNFDIGFQWMACCHTNGLSLIMSYSWGNFMIIFWVIRVTELSCFLTKTKMTSTCIQDTQTVSSNLYLFEDHKCHFLIVCSKVSFAVCLGFSITAPHRSLSNFLTLSYIWLATLVWVTRYSYSYRHAPLQCVWFFGALSVCSHSLKPYLAQWLCIAEQASRSLCQDRS